MGTVSERLHRERRTYMPVVKASKDRVKTGVHFMLGNYALVGGAISAGCNFFGGSFHQPSFLYNFIIWAGKSIYNFKKCTFLSNIVVPHWFSEIGISHFLCYNSLIKEEKQTVCYGQKIRPQ